MITPYSLLQMANALRDSLNTTTGGLFYGVQNSGTVSPDITEAEVIADQTPGIADNPETIDTWAVALDPVTGDYLVYNPSTHYHVLCAAPGGVLAGIVAVDSSTHVLGGAVLLTPVTFTAIDQLFECVITFRVGVAGVDMQISQ